MADIPEVLHAGEQLTWETSLARDANTYSNSNGYEPVYILTLLGSAGTKITISNSVSGVTVTTDADAFDITILESVSNGWTAGNYEWNKFAAKDGTGSNAVLISSGKVWIKPDLFAASTYDARSTWENIRDSLETLMKNHAGTFPVSYTYEPPGGTRQAQTFRDWAEIRDFYTWVKRKIQAEIDEQRISQGLKTHRRRTTRFVGYH